MNAIYHRVMRRENFETAAADIFGLLKSAQKQSPNEPRILYVDIDGHRTAEGEYDWDMSELQHEFGVGFLLQFFEEVHFPEVSAVNPNGQCNDIPKGLKIFRAENKEDNSLQELYIENYSNTEFISEPDVYEYLEKVSLFLKEYNDLTVNGFSMQEESEPFRGLTIWNTYIKELINELFTSFIYGNFISATAMTRTLIESYVYLSILIREKDSRLIEEWFLCSIIHGIRKYDEKVEEKVKRAVE